MNLQYLAWCLFSVLFCYVRATDLESSEDQIPIPSEYKFHQKRIHGISDPGSPWITGPDNKKYQFHIGRQSWLGAREHCLGQNSDLLTIGSKEELDWVLAHYEPQFPNLSERLIQIGLFIDSHDGLREWHWVTHKPLNTDILPWIDGEPFDHHDGRERCAVLKVNEKRIDDIDCDLSASMSKMYRFVCERTHEDHIKHEEVNNPLWKKLQDILDFFGISNSNKEEEKNNAPRPGEDEEDYWEAAKSENTTIEPIVQDNKAFNNDTTTDDIEGSGVEQILPEEGKSEKPAVAQAAKTVENSIIEDELIVDRKLEKLNSEKDSPKVEEKKPEVGIETTKQDPLEKIEEVPEAKKVDYFTALEKNMENLEKLVSAVEKMIDPLEGLKVVDAESPETGITSKENEQAKEVGFGNSAEFIAPVFGTYHPKAPHRFQYSHDDLDAVDGIMLGMLNHLLTFNRMAFMVTEENEENTQEFIKGMEEDFEEAEKETKAHPDINSGALLVPKIHQENIELCETEEESKTEKSKPKEQSKKQKVRRFLANLSRFLHKSSSQDLSSLLEESEVDGQSLLEKLNEIVFKATEKQTEKVMALKKELKESLLDNKETIAAVVNGTDEGQQSTSDQLPEQKVDSKVNESEAENKNDESQKTIEVTNIPTNETSESGKQATTSESVTPEPIAKEKPELLNKEKEDGYEVRLNLYLNPKNDTNNTKDESVFPKPDFSKIKPLDKIPEAVQKAVQEEKKQVDAAYDEFNKRIDTSALLKKIQETEKKRLALLNPLPIVTTAAPQLLKTTNELEKVAVKELEKMFEDIGRNFRTIMQG